MKNIKASSVFLGVWLVFLLEKIGFESNKWNSYNRGLIKLWKSVISGFHTCHSGFKYHRRKICKTQINTGFCVVTRSLHKQGCGGNKRAISSHASHFKHNVFSKFHFELYKLQVFLRFLLTIFEVLSSYCTNSVGRVICYNELSRLNQWPSQVVLLVKKPPANAGDTRDAGLIPGLGWFPGEWQVNPLQYSCLENPMDRGAWWAAVPGATKSRIQLKWLSMHACPFLWVTRSLNR